MRISQGNQHAGLNMHPAHTEFRTIPGVHFPTINYFPCSLSYIPGTTELLPRQTQFYERTLLWTHQRDAYPVQALVNTTASTSIIQPGNPTTRVYRTERSYPLPVSQHNLPQNAPPTQYRYAYSATEDPYSR